jgi:hypothetical protein
MFIRIGLARIAVNLERERIDRTEQTGRTHRHIGFQDLMVGASEC